MSRTYAALQRKSGESASEQGQGRFPGISLWRRDAVLQNIRPSQQTLEHYLRVKNVLRFSQEKDRLQAILLSGVEHRGGASTTAKNLALAMGQDEEKTVLVMDGNLRRPCLHKVFDLPLGRGLSEMAVEGFSPEAMIKKTSLPNLWLVTAGVPTDRPQQVFECEAFRSFLTHARQRFHSIVCDSAPVLYCAETLCLARAFDGIVLVAQSEKTRRGELTSCKGELEKVRAPLLGVILNRRRGYIPRLVRKFL